MLQLLADVHYEHTASSDWAEAFAVSMVAFAAAIVVYAWFRWGKDAYARDDQERYKRPEPPVWEHSRETNLKEDDDGTTPSGS